MIRQLFRRQWRRSNLVWLGCAAFLGGIGVAKTGIALGPVWSLLLAVPLPVALHKRTLTGLIVVLLFGLSLGWWRGTVYMAKLADFGAYYDQKVTITATAVSDGAYNKYHQLTFDARNVRVLDTGEQLTGKISLGGFGLNAVFAGDTIEATGKLKSSLGSYQGRMTYAQLTLVEHHTTIISDLRRKFTAGMQSALPEPLGSFGMGLLIGQRSNLPQEVTQDLLMVGLTHIIAVSGYNLTILLRASERVSGKRSKRLTVLFSLSLIGLFLLFAGNSASIVRAAIVSLLSIVAGYYGRQFKPLVLITMAAAITGFASPFYVWGDAGWYLSFLAFFGVMVVGPLIEARLPKKLRESVIAGVAIESMSAELMALPFLLHAFGQMSLVGLVGNILVVALVPLGMLLGFVAGLAGTFVPSVAGWAAWPAKILFTYMLDAAHLLAKVPHIFLQNLSFSWLQMTLSYVMIATFVWVMARKTHRPKAGVLRPVIAGRQQLVRPAKSLLAEAYRRPLADRGEI